MIKVRSIAARALVPLIPSQNSPQFVEEFFNELPEGSAAIQKDHNATHGKLLQIVKLLKLSVSNEAKRGMNKLLTKTCSLCKTVDWNIK